MKPDFFEENGSDFLTTTPVQALPSQTTSSVSHIPDLHTMEDVPDVQVKKNINSSVDTALMKKNTIEESIARDAESVKAGLRQAPKSPIEKLKILVDKGTIVKDFDAFGVKWQLRALDQSDVVNAYDDADTFASNSGKYAAIKLTTVCYAIEQMDGVSIFEWFPDIKKSDYSNNNFYYIQAIRRAIAKYLSAMPDIVIETLFSYYKSVEVERDEALTKLKNL